MVINIRYILSVKMGKRKRKKAGPAEEEEKYNAKCVKQMRAELREKAEEVMFAPDELVFESVQPHPRWRENMLSTLSGSTQLAHTLAVEHEWRNEL